MTCIINHTCSTLLTNYFNTKYEYKLITMLQETLNYVTILEVRIIHFAHERVPNIELKINIESQSSLTFTPSSQI